MKNCTTFTITLVLFILSVMMPVTAARYIGNTDHIDGTNISGITLVEDSIDSTYYHIPKYSTIYYFSDGYALISSYNDSRYDQVINEKYIIFNENNIPKDIEVPSESIVSPNLIVHKPNSVGLSFPREMSQKTLNGSDPTSILVYGDYRPQKDENTPEYFITYNNETILYVSWDKDAFANKSNGAPTTSSWVVWANIEPQTQMSYGKFDATWQVPNNPTVKKEYTKFYYFNGINSKSQIKEGYKQGIVQPVLAWNCGKIDPITNACTRPANEYHWDGMAITQYNTNPPSPQIIGRKIIAGSGDTIRGSLSWERGEGTNQWRVTFYNVATGETSIITSNNIIPNDSNYVIPHIALENPLVQSRESTPNICKDGRNKDRWPKSKTSFSNIKIFNQAKEEITQQMKATGNYNKDRFEDKEYNDFSCDVKSNYPQYDPSHYYVDTNKWNSAHAITIQPHQF